VKLRRLAFRGITRFQGDPVRLDFEALGPGLIAFVGANGQGKTTALEAVPACLYKGFPTRPGSLYDHAHGRDAFIEAEFFGQDADQVKVRVQVDTDRKTTEGYVFVNGKPTTTGRAKEFEAEVERLFGSESLFLASAFSAQSKAGSFLTMDRRSRKDLFVQLLGLSYLQALAERAHDRKLGAEVDLNVARKLLETATAEADQLGQAEFFLKDAQTSRHTLAAMLETHREVERLAAAELQDVKAAHDRREALCKALEAAKREFELADLALRDAEGLPRKAEEAAQRRRQSLSVQKPDEMAAAAEKRAKDARDRQDERLKEAQKTLLGALDVEMAKGQIEDLREEERGIRRRADEVAKAVGERDAAQARMDGAIRRLEDEDKRVLAETARLGRQAAAMKEAPCTQAPVWGDKAGSPWHDLAGTCPLLKDARNANRAILEVQVDPGIRSGAAAAREVYRIANQKHETLKDEFAERWASRGQEIEAALPGLEKTAARAGEMEAAKKVVAETSTESATIKKQLQADMDAIADLRESIFTETAKIAADLTAALADAGLKLEHARDRHAEAEDRQGHAEEALSQAPAPPFLSDVQSRADLATGARAKAERDLAESDQKIGRLESDVDKAKSHAVMAKQREAEAKGAEERTGDWGLLERALGREGVQALEIDAAGPEVSSITNELLAVFPGRRFTMSLETQREKKSEKGTYTEAFDVKIFDGAEQRQVEALSGGERVIVGEALGLALSIYNSRKSGVQYRTLWRDETSGALDPENAQGYIQMMRKAMEMGGFEQLLFVAHQEAVWERADVRLLVADGQIAVG